MAELKFLKVVTYFLENPYQENYLRQLAKKLKISPFAVKKYIDILTKEELIEDKRIANLRYFKPNINNLFFRYLKIAFNLKQILKSGILEFFRKNINNLSSIVLFGSMAKGENDKNSDIDILIIGNKQYVDLIKFEQRLGMEINMHIFSWAEWNKKAKEDVAFYNDVTHYGISLYGELPLVKWK